MTQSLNKKYKCITLVARNHGLESIKHILNTDNPYEIIAIFTHKLNPKSYDIQRKTRIDFKDFLFLSKKTGIPFFTIDYKEEKIRLENFTKKINFDFLISVSWRYIIPPVVFNKARIGSINLHRGDLPKYAGAEPIKRALENEEKQIAICSHIITEKIDEGKVLLKFKHPTNLDKNQTLEENVERLKKEITLLFPKLTMESLKLLRKQYIDKK